MEKNKRNDGSRHRFVHKHAGAQATASFIQAEAADFCIFALFFFSFKTRKKLKYSSQAKWDQISMWDILTDQSRIIVIAYKWVNRRMCWRSQQTIFLRDLLSARIRKRLLSGIATPTCIDVQLERKPTAAEGYGKAIKEVFCCWIWAERL